MYNSILNNTMGAYTKIDIRFLVIFEAVRRILSYVQKENLSDHPFLQENEK